MRIMLPNEKRTRLAELVVQHGTSRKDLSRFMGRGDGYLSRYLSGGVPYELAEDDHDLLARFFGVEVDTLRPAPPKRPRRWR